MLFSWVFAFCFEIPLLAFELLWTFHLSHKAKEGHTYLAVPWFFGTLFIFVGWMVLLGWVFMFIENLG